MYLKTIIRVTTFLCVIGLLLNDRVAFAQTDVIISGYVYDSSTNAPLQEAKVQVEEAEDVSPALTNKNGKYTIVISGRTEARITFSKEGYQPVTSLLKLLEANLKHDVRLDPIKISIEMTKFVSGAFIKGKVNGLNSTDYGRYKILVYVLTNKWFIHPFAENRARRGFAAIDSQGNWEIETVWRGYQAFKIAFLLVPKEIYPLSVVDLLEGKAPEISLFNAIEAQVSKIIPAPEGI